MTASVSDFERFIEHQKAVIRITLTDVRGSCPRDAGTDMFVGSASLWGTIGGGQLEYQAIVAARGMLKDNTDDMDLDIPLGPEIGQCCGGRVRLNLTRLNTADMQIAVKRASQRAKAQPHVYVLGAGHVGRALANQMQHLPVRCMLVDTRADELAQNKAAVETLCTAIPESVISQAPSGSAFVILTHDHGLDFLLASAALARQDIAYVGMIGSATKRAKFENWAKAQCDVHETEHLVCPIGSNNTQDKRPSVIASFVIAELMGVLFQKADADRPCDIPSAHQTSGNHSSDTVLL